ncbi:hypothetical protein SI65_09180 [Aspergillus cristatus]|uniref:Fungal-type protein kinase domain-containing protein n=1 Tax=Aspergillus cristatus TaxID=573508 RepID=A0A1E3B2T7_ASPCR|nr:hypothetical protein SI65_09180 [Aspergillus cristatus]
MTESLLDYLVKRNPTVIAPAGSAPGGPTFTFSEDWDTIENVEEWSEFNYETLTLRFGEDLRRQVPRFDATSKCEEGGYNEIYDERGLCDLICMSITGPVSAVLRPLFITSSGRVLESRGCYPDWGAGHNMVLNAEGRARALVLGDTKFNWSPTNAITTVQTTVNDSYEDAPMRDDVRPFEQVQYYGAVYKCRYVFIITENELVVMQLHLAPDPVRTSPRPVRTRPPPSHQRVISSSEISKQFTDMSIDESVRESVLKARIGLVKYKRIPWSAEKGLTIRLALYCLVRLADEDGNDLKVEYSSLVSPVSMVEEGN